MKIGVLAAQGAFIEHIRVFDRLGIEAAEVRLPQQLTGLDGLVIPGGESTTISKLILAYELADTIRNNALRGMALFGTCAGMIMLAKDLVDGNGVQPLRLMDIAVRRNAFGRQVDSFETELQIDEIGKKPFHGVFIRAPLVERVGPGVEVLSRLGGTIVAAKEGKLLACSFHPELTDDTRFHRYFVSLAAGK